MSDKMAYLIIAHKDDETFRTLCTMLDDERNDLFIHMDQKNKSYDETVLNGLLKKSKVYHCRRNSVSWGGYSQIETELCLLKQATQAGHYCHYHLLSGEDLPIKNNDTIYRFFISHAGEEFVNLMSDRFEYFDRVCYRYRFQDRIGRDKNLYSYLQQADLMLQKTLHLTVNRNVNFQKGANWFSITDDFARYILNREDWIREVFRHTLCADEIFLQTILCNSEYKDHLYYKQADDNYCSIMREIDWNRGGPYVFRTEDLRQLLDSDKMFARKFQADVDSNIIRLLKDTVN